MLVVLDVGPRTLARAQRVGHPVVQALARGGVPLGLTEGQRDDTMAVWAHWGYGVQPERKRARGPVPKPRCLPRPALRSAQVVQSSRRRRGVGVTHRVVLGTPRASEQGWAAWGWQSDTAVVERLTLALRQRGAAGGRRVNPLCQGEAGLQPQLVLCQGADHFVLPHASVRPPLPRPAATNGRDATKVWRPCTPAMAAGVTDHVWSLQEGLRYRVPPWPQLQAREQMGQKNAHGREGARGVDQPAGRSQRGAKNTGRDLPTG